jgi:hypothetical protein
MKRLRRREIYRSTVEVGSPWAKFMSRPVLLSKKHSLVKFLGRKTSNHHEWECSASG